MQKDNGFASIRWMLSFIGAYKFWFVLAVLATGMLIGTNLVQVNITRSLINTVLEGDNGLAPQLVIYLVLVITGTLLGYLRTKFIGLYSEFAIRDIKDQLANRLCGISFPTLSEIQAGDISSRVNQDVEVLGSFMKKNLPNISMHLLMGLAASLYILVLSWRLFLVSMLIVPLSMFLAHWLNTQAGQHYPKAYNELGKASGELEQSILGLEVIKTYNLQKLFLGKYNKLYNQIFTHEMAAQTYVSILQPVCFSLVYFPRLFCILYGGYMVSQGSMDIGTVVAVIYLLDHLAPPTVMLPFFMNNLKRATAAISRVQEVFHLPQERPTGTELKSTKQPILRFKGVSFSYGDGNEVLKDLDFSIESSQVTALVGVSGSGKTTITNLITGLLQPSAGTIEFMGSDISELSLQTVRNNLGVVSQDSYLFPGTIAENIGFGRLSASKGEIITAAKAAFAHEFIMALPRGYDTLIDEGGRNFSGGQRQRLALARAFLRDAPLVILDEPTSALDYLAEAKIQQAITRLSQDRGVLVIAHRLSTIAQAQQIIVLDQGGILDQGSHEELLERCGLYQKLYRKQFTA